MLLPFSGFPGQEIELFYSSFSLFLYIQSVLLVNIIQINTLLVISIDTNLVQITAFSHLYYSNSQERDYCSH